MSFNRPKHSDLQIRLIKALEALIANKSDFDNSFSRLLKSYSPDIPANDHQLVCDHVYNTFKTVISTLKQKEIINDDYENVFKFIATILKTNAWITALPERSDQLRDVTNYCILQMTQNNQVTLSAKSRKS